jgi:glycerate 2-kinase
VLHAVLGGEWLAADVSDPLGRLVRARWLELAEGTAVLDSAEAAGLPLLAPAERDPLVASTRGLGELLAAVLSTRPAQVVVGVGGTATVDGGAGLLEVVGDLGGVPLTVLCDVRSPLLGPRGAARAFGPQKGATPEAVEELERRLAARADLAAYRDLPGAGAAGGLGAALASLGGELVAGAERVLDLIGFDERAAGAALVVTGEGAVDRTTTEGKAPWEVRARCRRLGVRCELFGGRVRDGLDAHALSGTPRRAASDLEALGERLAATLAT